MRPLKVRDESWIIEKGDYKVAVAVDKQIMLNLIRLADVDENDYHVEIGTARGKSLTVVHEGHPSVKIISIDPAAQRVAKKMYKGNPRVELIPEKSSKGGKILRARGIVASTVYIDGDHSYKWCIHDIRRFWELWNGKGFFGGHDYTRQREKGWGVMKAVREFFEIKNDCRIDRRFQALDGVLHICDTFWFYIRNDQMPKYKDYLDTL